MMALLQSDDDISSYLHVTVMKTSVSDNGARFFLFIFFSLILEIKMQLSALWFSCAGVEVQNYPNQP